MRDSNNIDENVINDDDVVFEEGVEKSKPSPMPASIKYGLSGLGVFIFVVILSVTFMTGSEDSDDINEDEFAELVDSNSVVTHVASIKPPNATKHIDNVDGRVISDLKETVNKLQSNVDSYQTALNGYKRIVDEQSIKLNQFDEMFTGIRQQSITPLSNQVAALKKKLSDLNNIVGKNKSHINRFTKKGPSRPPFLLLSVDEWGNQLSAVLELNGRQSIASEGDIRAGWKINQILKPNCIRAVRLSDRKKAKVCRTGNA